MAERDAVIPPPPPGFVLDGVPPPPPGFVLDGAPPAPEGRMARYGRQLVGGAEAALSLATGSVAAPVAGLAGASQAITNAVVPGQISAVDRVHQVEGAMTYRPRSATGQNVLETVSYPFAKLEETAQKAGIKVAESSGSDLLGAETYTAIQAAPMAIGKVLSPIAKRAAALELTRQEVRQKLNAPKDADLATARDLNLTLSPAEANPNLFNRILEGFSGQAKVQQLASEKSRPMVNEIARRGLGISKDVPISVEVLEEVRKNAGKAGYEPVRNSGRVTSDPVYERELDGIASKYAGAEKDFPKMAQDDVRAAVDSARVPEFDAGSGLDAIKLQRQKADKAFRTGDTELGKAHKAVADAIEGQLERHLGETGSQALSDFRQARAVIARSYDVQKALKGNDVDARVLAAQLKKGRQLGGGLEDVAQVAGRFPGSFQVGGKNAYVPVSYFDGLMGGGAGVGALLHSPEMGAAAAATLGVTALRPAIRAGITSSPYQRLGVNPPSYGIGMPRRLAEAMTSDPALSAEALMQGQQQ